MRILQDRVVEVRRIVKLFFASDVDLLIDDFLSRKEVSRNRFDLF